jgi:Tol biopolymer transport system component
LLILALAYGPDWSPDGTHLVFTMNGQLFVTKADGTGTTLQLTSVPGGAGDPAWFK